MSPTDIAPVGTDLGSTIALAATVLAFLLVAYLVKTVRTRFTRPKPRHTYRKPTPIYDWKKQGL